MGLFGIGEVLANMEGGEGRDIFKTALKRILPTLEHWRKAWAVVIRGSVLGFFIGILPGGGATISAFVSYAIEKAISKHPEEFGEGAIQGVAAPESANNAAATSSFIPLLTLGIPGNSAIAMIFVALMIHGIQPGPMMMSEHPDVFWGVVASMYIANVILLTLNLPLINLWVRLLKVPYRYLGALVMVVCSVGAYSINNSVFDVGSMFVLGGIGYCLKKAKYPMSPWLLGMILGPKFEQAVQRALLGSDGDPSTFLTRPISLGLLVCAVLVALVPVFRMMWRACMTGAGGAKPASQSGTHATPADGGTHAS
jgi:putative tricarboxylic transport membrane protein